jgi:hypothetical protein
MIRKCFLLQKSLVKFCRMRINHLTFRVIGWVLFTLVFLTTIRSIAADDTNQWKVQVTSLQIIAPHPKSTNEVREKLIQKMEAEQDRLPGVAVKLRVTAPDGQVVGWNYEDSSLQSFTDDKGSNLLAQASQENYVGESESGISYTAFTRGEPSLVVEIRAPNLPSKGAADLNIIGKISVQTATGSEQQFTAENVKLTLGAKFNLGDLKLTVSDEQIMDKDKTFGVTLDSKQDLSSISTLEFFDSRGNKIKPLITPTGAVTSEAGDFQMVWLFQKPLNGVKIIGKYWTGFKTTEVPIAVKIGLGL